METNSSVTRRGNVSCEAHRAVRHLVSGVMCLRCIGPSPMAGEEVAPPRLGGRTVAKKKKVAKKKVAKKAKKARKKKAR